MTVKILFAFPVILTVLLGCSPTSQERKDMVQCSSGLKETFLHLQIAISAEPSLSTNSVARILGGIKNCPVTGTLYMANPDSGNWMRTNSEDEVAIYCPNLHYKALGQTRFAAITFAGTLVKLTTAPNWKILRTPPRDVSGFSAAPGEN